MKRDEIVNNIHAARTFIGEAQEHAPHLSDLWHVLGKLFDRLDEEMTMVKLGEYNDEGSI